MPTTPSALRKLLVCLALLCAALSGTFSFAQDIKSIHPQGYVTDLAGVIEPGTQARLESLCTELEQKTGAQMAIVTVRSLQGETASQYANELFKQLGVGGKKDDRGVLLLVAPNDRKYWTEVGYGLEPVINDARAGDAGRAMVPFLRQGNYSGGIEAAAWMLAKYIADDRRVTLSGKPPVRQVPRDEPSGLPLAAALWIVVSLIILISVLSRSGRGRGGRFSGGGGSGVGSALGWLIASQLRGGGGRGRGWGGGGWSGGGWGGSSGGGGFGGFGGGSSGGGGAGGSW